MTRKRPLLRRIVTWTAVGLVAAGAAVLVLRPSPAVVDLGAVDRGPLAETLDEDGKARLQHRALVVAPAAGRLEKPLVAPADTVTEGQLLARLEPLRAPLLDAAARAELQASVRMAEDAARQAGAVVQRALAAAEAAAANLARQEVVTGAGSGACRSATAPRASSRCSAGSPPGSGWCSTRRST
jgi:HlyD family secretion protein